MALDGQDLDKIREIVRDSQTEILRGFERYARGQFARFHVIDTQVSAALQVGVDLGDRITAIEERVLALETRSPRNGV
jgi:hypothetical protein